MIGINILNGPTGAVIILTLLTLPFSFISIANSISGIDKNFIHSAILLGKSKSKVIKEIVLPYTKPGIRTAFLLSVAYVLSDFAVTSMMGIQTITVKLYNQFIFQQNTSLVVSYSISLALLVIAIGLLNKSSQTLNFDTTHLEEPLFKNLGKKSYITPILFSIILIAPLLSTVITTINPSHLEKVSSLGLLEVTANSLILAFSCALVLTLIMMVRITFQRSRIFRTILNSLSVVFAIPEIVLAMTAVFLSLRLFGYQTFGLLLILLVLKYLPVTNNLLSSYLDRLNQETLNAAYVLSSNKFKIAEKITLPLVQTHLFRSVLLGSLFIFKDIAIVLILSPAGFQTLPTRIWQTYNEVFLIDATIYSLVMVMTIFIFFIAFKSFERYVTKSQQSI